MNISGFTPQQALYYQVIIEEGIRESLNLSPEEVDEIWGEIEENGEESEYLYDIRYSGISTNLPAPSSRHYESDQVAVETPVGWVSFTYWFGGGKHSDPDSIDWLSDAFFVSVEEKEVMTIRRTFTKIEG